MKLGTAIRLYLLRHHSLTLPGFGTIVHDGAMQLPDQTSEAHDAFARGSLSFIADPKVQVDDKLVEFISRETGKMRSLALSDLDSFLQFAQELINISKPFLLEGIGTLQRNSRNELEFIQSNEHLQTDRFRRSSNARKSSGFVIKAPSADTIRIIGWGLLALALLAGLWFTIRWFSNRPASVSEPDVKVSSSTSVLPTDSLSSLAATPGATRTSFGVVLEQSNRQRAFKRFADLKEWGHNVRMMTEDSVTFKLLILVNAPLKDTARHRDSLRNFFNRNVWIETMPDEAP